MMAYAQWFDEVGKCINCGRKAHGVLMSDRNERLGYYCKKCALARIKEDRFKRNTENPL